jgi:hypothetical protein
MKSWQDIQEAYMIDEHDSRLRDYEQQLFWWNIFYPEDTPNFIREPKHSDYKRNI